MEKDELLAKATIKFKNRYLAVNVLSKRIRQLKDEFRGDLDLDFRVALEIALKEMAEGKLSAELSEVDKNEKRNAVAE